MLFRSLTALQFTVVLPGRNTAYAYYTIEGGEIFFQVGTSVLWRLMLNNMYFFLSLGCINWSFWCVFIRVDTPRRKYRMHSISRGGLYIHMSSLDKYF